MYYHKPDSVPTSKT